jgi:hypothetical protein
VEEMVVVKLRQSLSIFGMFWIVPKIWFGTKNMDMHDMGRG